MRFISGGSRGFAETPCGVALVCGAFEAGVCGIRAASGADNRTGGCVQIRGVLRAQALGNISELILVRGKPLGAVMGSCGEGGMVGMGVDRDCAGWGVLALVGARNG